MPIPDIILLYTLLAYCYIRTCSWDSHSTEPSSHRRCYKSKRIDFIIVVKTNKLLYIIGAITIKDKYIVYTLSL